MFHVKHALTNSCFLLWAIGLFSVDCGLWTVDFFQKILPDIENFAVTLRGK
jgi:hypothetical protein